MRGSELASLARAWAELERLKAQLRGRPLPTSGSDGLPSKRVSNPIRDLIAYHEPEGISSSGETPPTEPPPHGPKNEAALLSHPESPSLPSSENPPALEALPPWNSSIDDHG